MILRKKKDSKQQSKKPYEIVYNPTRKKPGTVVKPKKKKIGLAVCFLESV